MNTLVNYYLLWFYYLIKWASVTMLAPPAPPFILGNSIRIYSYDILLTSTYLRRVNWTTKQSVVNQLNRRFLSG